MQDWLNLYLHPKDLTVGDAAHGVGSSIVRDKVPCNGIFTTFFGEDGLLRPRMLIQDLATGGADPEKEMQESVFCLKEFGCLAGLPP